MTASATTLPRRLSYAGIGARRTPPSVLREATIPDIVLSPDASEARYRVREALALSVWPGVALGVVIVVAVLGGLVHRDRRAALARKVRGGETLLARELNACVQPVHAQILQFISAKVRRSVYRIGGIPYPNGAETRHTLVCGDPGTGSPKIVAELLEQIRSRGERAAIYDPGGTYLRRFFDPGRDVILNPLDARSRRWSVVAEAQCPADFDRMAAAAIPEIDDGQDPFRVIAARQLFRHAAELLWRRDCRNNRILLAEHLMGPHRPSVLKGYTDAVTRSLPNIYGVEPPAEARDVLADRLSILRYVRADGAAFSIRDWMGENEGGGFLFITCEPNQHKWLRGLMSLWVETAVNGLLARPAHRERRAWAILNELPSLNPIPSLEAALADSGKVGGCLVLGAPSIKALRTVYGGPSADRLALLCGTSVVLRCSDSDTAEWCAKRLWDEFEPERPDRALAYGVDADFGDGSEERTQTVATEIPRLPADDTFLRFRGPFPAARIHLNGAERSTTAKRFEPIEYLGIIEQALGAARGRLARDAARDRLSAAGGGLTRAASAGAAPAGRERATPTETERQTPVEHKVTQEATVAGKEAEATHVPEVPDPGDGYEPEDAGEAGDEKDEAGEDLSGGWC